MKKLPRQLTAEQIIKLDNIAIKEHGIHSLELMEKAGRHVAKETLKLLAKKEKSQIIIFCGMGNNAGDGFVAARHLINKKSSVEVVLIGESQKLKKDAAVNYNRLKDKGIRIISKINTDNALIEKIQEADLVIDAIFGVGLNRNIEEPFKSFIGAINNNAKKVIAVDVPSGLDATTGKIYGACVRADITVTFTAPKTGFYINDGPQYSSKIIVVDIGIQKSLIKQILGKHGRY